MPTLEQVEKLRERANVTFEEAKIALEASGGDLLDALILLERQGKTAPPTSGGYYSGEDASEPDSSGEKSHAARGATFRDLMKGLGTMLAKLFNIGNTNHIDAVRNGETKLSCPVTILVILMFVSVGTVALVMLCGLFFGWRYRIRGTELGRDAINSAIETAENAVSEMKNTIVAAANSAHSKSDTGEE